VDQELERRENRLQKYIEILNPSIEDKPSLGAKEQKNFALMQTAYAWRTSFFSPDQVRKMLMKESIENGKERSYSTACQIYQDMEFIFGKTAEINKDALKRVQIESYYKLIQLVYKSSADEWEKAKRIESLLDKISKLYGLDENQSVLGAEMVPRNVQIVVKGGMQVLSMEGGQND
jgi:hypothetical protein